MTLPRVPRGRTWNGVKRSLLALMTRSAGLGGNVKCHGTKIRAALRVSKSAWGRRPGHRSVLVGRTGRV